MPVLAAYVTHKTAERIRKLAAYQRKTMSQVMREAIAFHIDDLEYENDRLRGQLSRANSHNPELFNVKLCALLLESGIKRLPDQPGEHPGHAITATARYSKG